MEPENEDTICAVATPPGTGGIGMIRVSGAQAFQIVDQLRQRPLGTRCMAVPGHTVRRAALVGADGSAIDDILLTIFHCPRSYTGEDVVEISAHGSPLILGQILARLMQCGARLARPGEFTQRAFLNGKMDLAQAEAVGDLIAAQTEQAHRQARLQHKGRLSRAVTSVRSDILAVLTQIEASIDFPEEVGELDTRDCEAALISAQRQVGSLLATADSGILQREGLQIVLAGRPNVGKSSLLNALLRTDRAIVTPVPGTTRDVIEETLNLRGIPLRVMDTAGMREAKDEVEKIGIARTRERIAEADIVLLVLDSVSGETPEDTVLRETLAARPHLIAWNKCDLQPMTSASAEGIPVSALTGWNLNTLEAAIIRLALGGADAGAESAPVTRARHKQALVAAADQLEQAVVSLHSGLPADFASIDLRGALNSLGQITGETATEDIIAEIFSKFCIGK